MDGEHERRWKINQQRMGQAETDRFKTFAEGQSHYALVYPKYFELLEISPDLQGKTVAELGSGNFPALFYCQNLGSKCYVFEPEAGGYLIKATQDKNIEFVPAPVEDCNVPKVDEVWIFNMLAHCIYPDVVIEEAKKAGKIIRFIERINLGDKEAKELFAAHGIRVQGLEYYFPNAVKTIVLRGKEYAYGVFEN